MQRTHITCRRCAFSIPADAPVCPGCRRPAIDDWRRRSRQHAVTARHAAKHAPPLEGMGYRPLLRLAVLVRPALGLVIAVAVVTTVAHLVWTFSVDEPLLTVGATTVDVEPIANASAIALLGIVALTGLLFVAWALRAYMNLPALGIRERRYWTMWLVVGWVIPGANLLVPKLLVDDIWRASSPQVPVDAGGDSWHRRPVASIVNRWWCSFLLTPAVVVLAVVTARGGLEEFEQRVAVGALVMCAAVALAVAATAARRLIAVVTVAQARRADVVVDLREDRRAAAAHVSALDLALERALW